MRSIILFLLFISFRSFLFAQSQPGIRQLDSVLTQLHKTSRFNGTVLYGEQGKVLYRKAFGYTDCCNKQPLNTHSAFNLASVSKQFIAMCIMILKEKKLLQYDDNCKKYIPELPYNNITIRHLLTHTSGIPEYFDVFQRYKTPLDTLTNEQLLSLYARHQPATDFAPGEKWAYCNTNYTLLVNIIERVSKEPLDRFFNKHIAIPLGLKNTYVYHVLMPAIPANHVYGFSETGEQQTPNDLTAFDGIMGDGNVYSSVEDLYKWEQSLTTKKLVPLQTLKEAFEPVQLNNGETYPYGFGWFTDKERPSHYWHTGGWVGFINVIYRDVQNKRTIIILSNGSNGAANRVARDFVLGRTLTIPNTKLIQNIQLIDGTGTPVRNASVRIEGKRIIAVGNLIPFEGEEVINGEGNILAPGFIDSHSHLRGSLSKYPEAIAALNQGITTIVSGQDGDSDPADSIKVWLNRTPAAINVATYTGHASIREQVMGAANLSRPATPEELEKIKILLKEDLQKGSLGLSSGLEYEAGFYSNRHELIELAKVAAAEKARYISHIRSEDISMNEALDEIIHIGREAKLPVQVSHIKIALKDDWKTSTQILATLQQARNEGIDITADCYPYNFWNSTIRVLFPKKDFTSLAGAQYAVDHLFDPAGSIMVRFAPDKNYEGKTISAIAALRNETPAQTLLYLVVAAETYKQQHPGEDAETIMGKAMHDDDVSNFLSWAHTNICSDGSNGGHPRGHGSFTRVLSYYVKEKKIMSWEDAIRKMTSLPAEHTGIKNRGIIAPGYFADMVLINPNTVKDNASVQNPKALSDGIVQVWVNGVPVYRDKSSLKNYPGEFIER